MAREFLRVSRKSSVFSVRRRGEKKIRKYLADKFDRSDREGRRSRGVTIDSVDFLRRGHASSFRRVEIAGRPSGWRGFKARKRGNTRGTRQPRDGSKLQFMFNRAGSSLTRTRYGLYKRDVYLRSPGSNWVQWTHVPAAFLSFASSFSSPSYFRSFNIPTGA